MINFSAALTAEFLHRSARGTTNNKNKSETTRGDFFVRFNQLEQIVTAVHARAFWRGYVDCSPFILIVIPYSMLFGVVALYAGLDIIQTMATTVLVITGAAQFTALALLQEQAPVFVVLLAALTVNLSTRALMSCQGAT